MTAILSMCKCIPQNVYKTCHHHNLDDYARDCIRFAFMQLIQADLDNTCRMWNTHVIRPSREDVINGIPDELYFLPNNYER